MAENGKIVIIGGGATGPAVKIAGVADKMTHVSTGGGASLEFLERSIFPGSRFSIQNDLFRNLQKGSFIVDTTEFLSLKTAIDYITAKKAEHSKGIHGR
ncbi:hypothetical protein MASR1M12_37400 [Erysipelotrichia bacterium]